MKKLQKLVTQGFTDSGVSYAEVRIVPTTVGATGSLSRILVQCLGGVCSENYSIELQKMANLGTAHLLRKIIMKHMNLFQYFP
jgi:hypothetical protein